MIEGRPRLAIPLFRMSLPPWYSPEHIRQRANQTDLPSQTSVRNLNNRAIEYLRIVGKGLTGNSVRSTFLALAGRHSLSVFFSHIR